MSIDTKEQLGDAIMDDQDFRDAVRDAWARSILSLYYGTMPLNLLVATLWSIKRRRIVRSVEAFNWWFFFNEVSR
jgi:hypothetical protein